MASWGKIIAKRFCLLSSRWRYRAVCTAEYRTAMQCFVSIALQCTVQGGSGRTTGNYAPTNKFMPSLPSETLNFCTRVLYGVLEILYESGFLSRFFARYAGSQGKWWRSPPGNPDMREKKPEKLILTFGTPDIWLETKLTRPPSCRPSGYFKSTHVQTFRVYL